MTQSINQLMNHEAVYRTAPATPGLLITPMTKSRCLYPGHNFKILLED